MNKYPPVPNLGTMQSLIRIQKGNSLQRFFRHPDTVGVVSMSLPPTTTLPTPSHHQQSVSFSTFRPRHHRRRVIATQRMMPKPTRRVNAPKGVPSCYRDMDELSLVTLGGSGNYEARQEILKRHIMATDQVSYEEASKVFAKIEEKNYEWMKLTALPFQISIVAAGTAALASIPLVFHLPTVEYFNEHFVTAEHPPLKELETALEVGRYVRIIIFRRVCGNVLRVVTIYLCRSQFFFVFLTVVLFS